jgi:hypothetical protein
MHFQSLLALWALGHWASGIPPWPGRLPKAPGPGAADAHWLGRSARQVFPWEGVTQQPGSAPALNRLSRLGPWWAPHSPRPQDCSLMGRPRKALSSFLREERPTLAPWRPGHSCPPALGSLSTAGLLIWVVGPGPQVVTLLHSGDAAPIRRSWGASAGPLPVRHTA